MTPPEQRYDGGSERTLSREQIRLTEFDALVRWPVATQDKWRALAEAFKADDGVKLAELTGAIARYGPILPVSPEA